MAIDEHSRHDLYRRLEEVLGADAATTLMEHLPPVGWADVATKRDLGLLEIAMKRDVEVLEIAMKRDVEVLEIAMKRDLEVLEYKITASLHQEIGSAMRTTILSMIGIMITLVSLNFAAVHFG
jgi:predicted TIM-barrel enzyme